MSCMARIIPYTQTSYLKDFAKNVGFLEQECQEGEPGSCGEKSRLPIGANHIVSFCYLGNF